MPLPTLYNTRTTVVDLSTAVFADSASQSSPTPGVSTATSVSLYQSSDPINSNGTYALIPIKVDFSGCDTVEFSFRYDRGAYVPQLPDEALELGFYVNAGDFANYTPWNQYGSLATDELGIGGALDLGYDFRTPENGIWQFLAAMPPRTEYPSGAQLLGEQDVAVSLTAGAFDGSSTLTLRVTLNKGPSTVGGGYDGETVTIQDVWVAENGNTAMEPSEGSGNPVELSQAQAAGTSPDILGAPYQPLTITPYVRRVSFYDSGNNPMTLSDLSITVGSSQSPQFWTDLLGCAEQI